MAFLTQPQFLTVGLAFGVNTHSQGSKSKRLLIQRLTAYFAANLHIWRPFHNLPPVDANTTKSTKTAIFKVSLLFLPNYQATHAHYVLTLAVQLVAVQDLHASQYNMYIDTTTVTANG
jgi:hypothetical protein